MRCLVQLGYFTLTTVACLSAGNNGWAQTPPSPAAETAAKETAPAAETPAAAATAAAPATTTPAAVASALPVTPSETWTGAVTLVQSGDRFTIEHDGQKIDVRLYGVDCPEPGQPFSNEAKQALMDAVTGKNVTVEVLTKDSLGIPVVNLQAGDIANTSVYLLEKGLAWWDNKNVSDDRELKKANAASIGGDAGLWGDKTALAPWDYRRSHQGEQFTYSLKEEEKPAAAKEAEKKEEEPKKVSAKGDAVYTGTFTLPANAKLPENVSMGSLMATHMPRIEKDASGNSIGLTATDISKIPFAKELGLQDGDVISSVNGMKIESEAQVIGLAQQLQGTKQFNLEVLRGGQRVTIPIVVP